MKKTTYQTVSKESCKTTGIQGLMQYIGSGRATAERIARLAGARIEIGGRVLYNLSKIDNYLDSVSGK